METGDTARRAADQRPERSGGSAGAVSAVPVLLRTGVALCFIGHGAYGIITKAAWIPYFGVVGISEAFSWKLMPWVGTMDVAIGFLAFAWPCRALFAWAAAWATWTALLRPLAGQGWSEFIERAGNYGVPLSILAIIGVHGPWLSRLPERWSELARAVVRHRAAWALRITVAVLLAGHAGCALFLRKDALAQHYAVFWPGNAADVMLGVGGFEFALAAAVLAFPTLALCVGIVAWKLATESLFLFSGATAPVFEVIERGGSYIAPLALAVLLSFREHPQKQAAAPAGVPAF